MTPPALVAYLATRWRHMPFASRTLCHHLMFQPLFANFGHQVELLALQIWPPGPGGSTCISSKFGHQVAPLSLLATRSHNLPHCLGLPYWHQLVLSWYLHQPESCQLSLKNVLYLQMDRHPDPKIGPQIHGSEKNSPIIFLADKNAKITLSTILYLITIQSMNFKANYILNWMIPWKAILGPFYPFLGLKKA